MNIYNENENHWFTKDRSETISGRVERLMPQSNISISNPGLGLNIYHNVFSKDDSKRYIDTLEHNLSGDKKHKWSEAKVTNSDAPNL